MVSPELFRLSEPVELTATASNPTGLPPPKTTKKLPAGIIDEEEKVCRRAAKSQTVHPENETGSSPVFTNSTNSSLEALRTPSRFASPNKPFGGSARISLIRTEASELLRGRKVRQVKSRKAPNVFTDHLQETFC